MKFLSNVLLKAGLIVEGTTDLQGTSTAVTPTLSDSSTKIATTAFVKGQGYAVGNIYSTDGSLSGNRTITLNGNYLDIAGVTKTRFFANGNVVIDGASPVDAGYKLDVNGTVRLGSNPAAVQLTINGRTTSVGSIFLQDALFFTGTNKIIYANDLTFNTTNTPSNGTATRYLFTQAVPSALSGAGTVDLVKILMPVNTGAGQNVTSRGLVIDFSVTTNSGTLTAIDAIQGLIRLRDLAGTGDRMVVANSSGVLSTQAIPALTGYVPYTGATANLDLGTYNLSAYNLIINHTSSSGAAASITKGGNGEALTVVKSSGSGNAASITGGVTLLSELHLTTALADAYIASATNWNTAYSLRITSATSPLSITSNVISIAQASGSTNGYLSSTDWTTFNNKQNALTNPVTGTGTTNYLPKFTGASTIGDSQVIDDGDGVGIGLISPQYKLHVVSSSTSISAFRNSGASAGQILVGNTVADLGLRILASGDSLIYSDTSKYLAFGTNGATEKMRLDASGNLGLGVTPSAWRSVDRALQIGLGSFWSDSQLTANFSQNHYFSSTGRKYIANGRATDYEQYDGYHAWKTAPSGTAGNAISFTQAMTLNASGNLSIGNTNNTYKLDVSGDVRFSNSAGNNTLIISGTGSPYQSILKLQYDPTAYGATFTYDASPEIVTIENYGRSSSVSNQGSIYFRTKVNNTTPTDVLKINGYTGAATFSSSVTAGASVTIGTGGSYAAGSIYSDASWGMIFRAKQASPTIAQFMWANSADSELMRISPSGGLLIGTTPDSGYKLDVAGTSRFSGTLETTSGGTERHIRMLGYNSSYVSLRTNTGFNSSYNAFNVIVNSNSTDSGQGNSALPSWEMVVGGNLPNADSFYIGRSAPGSFSFTNLFKLSSTGAATFAGTISGGGNIELVNAGGPYVLIGEGTGVNQYAAIDWDATNNRLRIATQPYAFGANGGQITLTTGGLVGIGTTSPSGKLDVFSSNDVYANIYTSSNNTSAVLSLYNSSGVTDGAAICYNVAMRFGTVTGLNGTGFTERMRISSAGNVGIGTTSPNSTLQVRGDNGSSVSAVLRIRDTNSTARTTRLQFEDYNGTLADGLIDFKIPTAGSAVGARLDIGVDGAIMSLVRGGNVGIGTTSPNTRLHVLGSGTVSRFESTTSNSAITISHTANGGLIGYSNQGATGNLFYVTTGSGVIGGGIAMDNNGNVGIGTTSADSYYSKKLVVYAGSEDGITIANSGTTGSQYLMFADGTSGVNRYRGYMEYAHTGDYMVLATASAERMRITSGGNVGIGTTSPSYKLDVNGTGNFSTARANYFDIPSGTGFNAFQMGADTFSGGWYVYNSTTGSYNFKIANSGAATFSGNVRIDKATPLFVLNDTSGSGAQIGSFSNNLNLIDNATGTKGLVISLSTGAATFSSSVQTGGNIRTLMTGTTDVPSIYAENNVGSLAQIRVFGTSAGGTLFGVTRAGWSSMDTNNGLGLLFGTTDTAPIVIGTSNTERMRITSSGNVGIGNTNNTYKLDVTGQVRATAGYVFDNQTGSGTFSWYGFGGNIYAYSSSVGNLATINGSTGAYTATSDINKKKDFELSTLGLDAVMGLKPTLYRMKSEYGTEKHLGFIAQEVKDYIPQAYVKNGEFIGLNEMPLIAALTRAVQELKAELDSIKNNN